MPTQTLPSFILSQQRQVCCGGTVEVQTDLVAASGWQGPHGSLRAGRVSSLPGLFLPPGGPDWGILFCSDGCFIASSLPTQPHSSLLSAGPCASLGERRNPPLRPRTVESCLVRHYWEARALSCPYQSQGESVWLEGWNLNAIVSDFVTFLLGRVNPPLPAP